MLKEGIYEEIINNRIKDQITKLSSDIYNIDKEKIDVEEARKILSSYVSNSSYHYMTSMVRVEIEALHP